MRAKLMYHEALFMISLDDFLEATGGQVLGEPRTRVFTDFAFDSRIVEPGQLFLAVVTETGDGHDFIPEAQRSGATGIVCQRPPTSLPAEITCIFVENTQQALLDYARYILAKRQIEVIGVTGSLGKTSTKEAIAAVLGVSKAVFKNYGNYSGRFGLPIALGKLGEEHKIAVLEMACDSFDEIRDLADITRPKVGVVTLISYSHLQYLGTLENIAREKGRLIEALPAEGTAILNEDDPFVRAMGKRAVSHVITYGLNPQAELYADEVSTSPEGTTMRIHWHDHVFPIRIPFIGVHHAYTALAAAAVGLTYGLSWEEIAHGLESVTPLPGRTRLLKGVNGALLLDDSYNADPTSVLAALRALRALPARRRLVLLGDMAHLGDYTEEAHRVVGRYCAEMADWLITKGELAQIAADEALSKGMPRSRVQITFSPEDAIRALRETLQAGDLLLIKGSGEARLEMITRELLENRKTASAVLPRQHRGWAQVRLERPGRPTWVEISLDAIAENVRRIVEWVGPHVHVMAVLKADGYGHGALRVAHTALNNGATWLGVACLGEAIALRRAGVAAPILILGYTPAWQARDAVLHDVTVTIFSPEVAAALSRAAQNLNRVARAHVKVDTGMGRLGLMPEEVLPFVKSMHKLPALEVEGIFTHMAAADDADLSYTYWQLERFNQVLAALRSEGLLPRYIHAANSAAMLRVPESHYNMVRPGIALYGLNPSSAAPLPEGFRPALSFKCQVAQVKELPEGSYVGYGCTYRTKRRERIAVIPVGYADGFRRAPAHWGEVLVRGRRAPIVGRVCMDQTMINVTDIPGVRQGDEVVLIGSQGEECITVDEVAQRLGTINYEVISEILARVPRIA